MSAHALCAVLTCIDAARAGASDVESSGLGGQPRGSGSRSGTSQQRRTPVSRQAARRGAVASPGSGPRTTPGCHHRTRRAGGPRSVMPASTRCLLGHGTTDLEELPSSRVREPFHCDATVRSRCSSVDPGSVISPFEWRGGMSTRSVVPSSSWRQPITARAVWTGNRLAGRVPVTEDAPYLAIPNPS
jgi:hypothetical protein